jgi:putative ABC transport system permease protein
VPNQSLEPTAAANAGLAEFSCRSARLPLASLQVTPTMLYFLIIVLGLLVIAALTLPLFFLLLYLGEVSLRSINVGRSPKFLLIMLKSLRRNRLRTSLTYLVIFALVYVVTAVWSILAFLSKMTEAKTRDLKVIVTEKFQLPSQMPPSYARAIEREALDLPEHLRPGPEDMMTWSFYGGTLDDKIEPAKRTRENLLFFFAMEPERVVTMMDDLEDVDRALVQAMKNNIKGAVVGRERLQRMQKTVGQHFKVYSINYVDIDLDFEIVGVLPEGRYNDSAIMNSDYLKRGLDDYERNHQGTNNPKHPLADKSLNLVWIRLPSTEAFEVLAERLAAPGKFSNPSIKCETASSGLSSWLDAYRDLVWGLRWLLSPAILATMALVVANAISISVRERTTEMAVLKVLGYRPWMILVLVLGEALVIGALSGFISSGLAYVLIDLVYGGFKFPIAFFPTFMIPKDALWWGPTIGAAAAFLGSIGPAWSARTVKVSEVFSKVA